MSKTAGATLLTLLAALIGGCGAGEVQNINSGAEFQANALTGAQPVLVEFYMTLCPACVALEPKLADLAGEYRGRARFVRIENKQANQAGLLSRYGITAFPTVIVFVNGQQVGSPIVGNRDKQTYRDLLNQALAAPAASTAPVGGR